LLTEMPKAMQNHMNIIFGINPVLEKLKASSADIQEIIVAETSDRERLRSIIAEARGLGLNVTYLPARELDRLSQGQRHQGVLARVKAFPYPSFDELLERIANSTEADWILVLDGIIDPRNFGALLRTAEAAGVKHVVIPKDRSAEVTPVAVKASAGAVHHLHIYKVTNLRRSIQELKRSGYWTVALDAKAHESIYDRVYPEKLAIVLGGEGKGVRPVNLRECDFYVSIPMLGEVGSLNVGVAGAVFLYELVRRRRLVVPTASGRE
jgi:23S rRNA (guanosine2251-2'-O)-methyltransferase